MGRYVTRAEWGATPRGATRSSHPIGDTYGVSLHWEGPRMGSFGHDKCAFKVRVIQRFHKGTRGWADIAYNLVVCPHGYVFEGRGAGVTSAANGDTQSNADWYAVCYLGGEGDGFTDAGKAGMTWAVQYLRKRGAGRRVNGHRDHKATACPGDAIYRWLQSHNFDKEDDDMTPAQERLLEQVARDVQWLKNRHRHGAMIRRRLRTLVRLNRRQLKSKEDA